MPLPDAAPVFFGKIACFDRATSAAGTIARAKEDTLINPGGHTARAIARALLIVVLAVPLVCGAADADRNAEYARWIEEMKRAERGPFARIRWFCKDGQVLPPESYACKPFGGGSQHGEWSDRTKTLRDAGYYIANFYSDLDVDTFVERHAESGRFAQMLIEQFLIRIDDRWILRQAQFYRGAYQEEGERRGARRLLFKLAERGSWLDHRYLVLRTAARYLKHGPETPSVQEIRQLSASLSEKDPAFKPLRNKIHGTPELADAEAVRAYAAKNTKTAFNEDEFQDLLFELNIRPGSLAGDSLDSRMRELVAQVERNGRFQDLVTEMAGKRPHLFNESRRP